MPNWKKLIALCDIFLDRKYTTNDKKDIPNWKLGGRNKGGDAFSNRCQRLLLKVEKMFNE
jgi:hypothetical protein